MDDSSNLRSDSTASLPLPHSKHQLRIRYQPGNAILFSLYRTLSQFKRIQSHNLQQQSRKIVDIDPCLIRFSQDTVNNPTRIKGIENSMKKNGWNGDAIDVVRMPDGKLTSVDNRRVLAAKRVAMKVKARIHDHNEPLKNNADRERFTVKRLQHHSAPEIWGKAVELRVLNQNSFYMRNMQPYGTYDEPYTTGPNTSKRINKHDYDLPEEAVKDSQKGKGQRSKRVKAKDTTPQTARVAENTDSHTSQNSRINSKSSKMETDHTSFREHKHTTRAKTETMKNRLQKKQTSRALVIHSVNSRTSQTSARLRTRCRQDRALGIAASSPISLEHVTGAGQGITARTKFGGLVKTITKYQRIVGNGPTHKFMYERRVRMHENPFYKKKTFTEEGKNHLNPSQNYKQHKSKYSVGRGTKAVAKAGINTVIDKALYALFATDKGRPSLGEAVTTVIGAAGTAFVSSVVPGGRLLTTLGAAVASQNYENLPLDLLLAAPSLIPGNPIHFEHQQTQATAPLFGSDLRSDNVDRFSADLSVPYLHDLGSVGLCYDREQIEFSRDGVKTNRNATAVNVHASLGSALDASLGFSSGTETSDSVTKETANGMTETTWWEKQFSGQLGARVRAADRKAAWDIGSAFNEETTTTTLKTKSDKTAISVRDNLPLRHLEKVEDRFQRNSETTSHVHKNYVRNESAALPSDGRVEIVHSEQTIVKESKTAYGWWETAHKTEKYDLYIAEENTVHRSDQQLANEVETILTHRHVELSGCDLRETIQNTNEKYQLEEKRDKETVKSESTDKTKIISKTDGTIYDVRQSESTVDTKTVKEIERDYYKKIQHLDTNNEIVSTVGQKDTISTVRNVEGILQPEVTTRVHETQQSFERTNELTTFQDPHLERILDVKQSYGLLTNKTETTAKTLISGENVPEETVSEVVETLGGAAHGALSSFTSNVLHLACDPAARTMRNVRNAVIDVGMQGAVGWAHSNVAVRENSAGSAAVAAIVSVAANGVTKVCSSNSETLSTKKVLTDVALSSASPAVSVAANVSTHIPIPLRNHAGIIASLIIRTGQTIQDYRESRVNLEEAKTAILQEITSIITNCGIQTYLVPELVALLPLSSLGASVVACIAGAALSFASFKLISWVMNMRQERLTKQEYEKLCKDLEVNLTDTDAAVDSRYRRLALTVHPDKVGGDATRFKKLTQDFQRLHQLRSRYNILSDKSQTTNILQLLKEFLQDPMSFIRYLSQMTTSSASDDPVVIESPLMLTA